MITKFKLFESTTRMSDQEIHRICKKYDITGYDINPDGSISVDGNVDLSSRSLKRIPLNFKEISGHLNCYDNQLTSLEGCPEKVGDYFSCSHNLLLKSLKGCPDARTIYCYSSNITSFEGIPEFWEGELDISGNPVSEIFRLFNRDINCIDLINDFDVIQGDRVIRDRLEEVYVHMNMEIPKNFKLKRYKLI